METPKRLLLAGLAVVLLAVSASAATLVTPDRLLAGQPAGVVVLDAAHGRTYFARLQDAEGDAESVQSEEVQAEGRMVRLDLPVGTAAGTHDLQVLHVVTKDNGTVAEVVASREVQVEAAEPWLFLEADKPVYKAGSTIRVRVLCLMPDLKPCTEPPSTRLVLKNPDNIKVFAADGVFQSGVAVAEGSLPLDERSPVGTYTIVAETPSDPNLQSELEVAVEEYVLPKFEVSVTTSEQFLLPNSKSLSGVIRAVYSYGEKVQGTAVLRATFEQDCYYGPWFGIGRSGRGRSVPLPPREECGEIVLAEKSVSDFVGNHSFELSLGDPDLSGYNKKVELSVVVTETATGTQINGTATIPVERANRDSKVTVTSPKQYQPGLPVPVTVESRRPDGSPDDGQFLVKLTFRSSGWRVRHQETVVQEWVRTKDGVGRVELPAPRALPCCMLAVESAAASDDENELERLFGPDSCCWGTVTPEVNRGNGTESIIRASTEYGDCIEPAYPPGYSYLSVRPKSELAGKMQLELLYTGDINSRDFVYMVTSTNGLIDSGKVDIQALTYNRTEGYSRGTFSLSLTEQMIPEAHILVSVLEDDGTLLADEAKFEVDLALLSSQPVELEIESTMANDDRDYVVPGERVQIRGSADPGSVLFLGAVDRSVSFLSDKDTRVSPSRIFSALKDQAFQDKPDPNPWGPPGPEACWHISAFAAAGLSRDLSGALPRDQRLCFLGGSPSLRYSLPTCRGGGWGWGGGRPGQLMLFSAVAPSSEADVSITSARPDLEERTSGSKRRERRTLRQAFPETWVWSTADVNANGDAVMFASAPDTITTWDVSGFALGAGSALGLPLRPAALRVFKPLFVELKLPYKVVRGEVLEVVMTVYNYLGEAQDIDLVLQGSGGAVVPLNAANQALTVPANSAASRSAMLTFEQVGTATLRLHGVGTSSAAQDAVERSLRVVPEGVADSRTLSVVLQPSEATDGMQQLTLPAFNASAASAPVPGSLHTRLTLSGDLMGPTLEGLDGLVRLPSGCGEQNMILLAPNVYIMNYLDAKRDARAELRQRALGFIQTGYSRELQYRHPDGSFSAFGESDDSGSTWLTAFVLKVFAQAHAAGLVEVDAGIASEAAMWLLSHQAKNGSFASVGRVIHADMMGGVGDDPASGEAALTAFVATALLEARSAGLAGSMADAPVALALNYLQATLQETDTLSHYASVLAVHTLTLAHTQGLGDALAGTGAIELLQSLALRNGTFVHWAPRHPEESKHDAPEAHDAEDGAPARRAAYTVAQASGPEVEMTGYGLHTLVLAEQGLAEGLPVVRWLLSERSDTGGWKSTQDTIVALEGLAAYAAEVSTVPPEMTVSVTAGSGPAQELRLSASNADVVQHLDLAPGAQVAVAASGAGMAVLSVTTVWHSTSEPELPALEVVGEAVASKHDDGLEAAITLRRSDGPAQSGMMVAEIGLFSGYAAEASSVEALQQACGGRVKRVETPADGRVVVYLEELPVGKACHLPLALSREVRVDNVQPVPVEAYYYYTPDKRGSSLLHPPAELR